MAYILTGIGLMLQWNDSTAQQHRTSNVLSGELETFRFRDAESLFEDTLENILCIKVVILFDELAFKTVCTSLKPFVSILKLINKFNLETCVVIRRLIGLDVFL